MKTCTRCNIKKPYSEYHRHKGRSDGFNNICKCCKTIKYHENEDHNRKRRKLKYAENRECELENNKIWRANNLEKGKAACRAWTKNNKEKHKLLKHNWIKNNLGKNAAAATRYYAAKKNRTPKWLSEKQHDEINKFYLLSADLTKKTGVKYNVDHVVPLQGETVCGLHVPWNLQVITALENSKKGNVL